MAALRTAVLLALAASAAAQFPCAPAPPCVDDPTFVIFDIFDCEDAGDDTINVPLCNVPQVRLTCPATCRTCQVCQDPDPIPGIQVIVQYGLLLEDGFFVYLDTTATIAGFQAQIGCDVNGKSRPPRPGILLSLEHAPRNRSHHAAQHPRRHALHHVHHRGPRLHHRPPGKVFSDKPRR